MKILKFTTFAAVGLAGLLARVVAQEAPVAADATAAPAAAPGAPAATAADAPAPAEATPSLADIMKRLQALEQENSTLKQQMLERQNAQGGPNGGSQFSRGRQEFGGRGGGGRGGRGRDPLQGATSEDIVSMFNQAAPGVTATNHSGLTDTNATIELNFRQAPLEQVLNYLSEAAGFVVALETSISRNATVDLWSQQKVSPKDAVRALDASLKRNGYSAIEDNNVLTIVSSGNRTSVGIPVITINSTNEVPISERLVTAVVPIRFIGAQEVMQIVYPLVPTTALISPSVSGNSLVITDTLSTVHRAVNVIRALDNPVATGTKTEVVFLNYMDAQTMAAIIQTLYQNQGGRGFGGGNNNALQQLLNLRGGGFGGGGFGGGGFGGGGGGGGGRGGGRGGRGGGGGFGF